MQADLFLDKAHQAETLELAVEYTKISVEVRAMANTWRIRALEQNRLEYVPFATVVLHSAH